MGRTIQSTTDYDAFKLLGSNRRLYKPHVKRLVAAFEGNPRSNAFVPVLVNENMEIIDGQHRVAALKELGLPVHFIIADGLDISDAHAINAGAKPWSPMDYARSFASQGKKAYAVYVALKEEFKFNHDILLRYLALDEPTTGTAFKNGKLHVTDKKRTYELANKLAVVQKITGNKHRALAFALLNLDSEIKDFPEFISYLSEYYDDGKQLGSFKDTEDYERELRKFL